MAPKNSGLRGYYQIGDVLLGLFASGNIEDAVWDEFLGCLDNGVKVILSLTSNDSPGISATQRKKAADIMKRTGVPGLVVTNSRTIRGILTAVSWLGAKTVGFAWNELEKAIAEATSDTVAREKISKIALEFKRDVVDQT